MTDAELQAIEARAKAATEGPWEAVQSFGADAVGQVVTPPAESSPQEQRGYSESTGAPIFVCADDNGTYFCDMKPADALFIAHARADVPALAAEVRRLRALLKAAEWHWSGDSGAATCPHCGNEQSEGHAP